MKSISGAGVRKSAIRAGLLAVSAAAAGAAGLAMPRPALGDITVSNPFSNFTTPKVVTSSSSTGIGYNSSGTAFELTNGNATEATMGLYALPQTITSFDVSFTLTATGTGDDGAFVITGNNSAISGGNTNIVGGSGTAGGYVGSGGNSLALQWTFDGASSSYNNCADGLGYNGGSPSLTYFYNVVDQGALSPYTNVPVLNSGDPIQVNLAYFGTTLTENIVDLHTHMGLAQVYTGVNLSSVVGGSTAYVGFSGGSSSNTSTQTISNFTLVSNKTYNPISITTSASTGFNAYGIVSANASNPSINATQDNGKAGGGNVWYEQGYNTSNPSTGLPKSGVSFTSNAHTFQMQSYASSANGGNGYGDVILLSSSSYPADGPSTVTIPFASTNQPYNALSFLTASGNGPNVVGLQINYSNGTTSSGLQFLSPDWFSGVGAFDASGRADCSGTSFTVSSENNVNGTSPDLYAEDVLVPNNAVPISSLVLTFAGGNHSVTGNVFIFAISGEAGATGPIITYTGVSSSSPNYVWNLTNQNFNGVSGSQTVAVQYAPGDQVYFDDTSPTSSHNVTLGAANMNASTWNVNTSTGYSFSGNGMNGSGGLYINTTGGTGTVVLGNSNTYVGSTTVGGGLLQMNSSSAIASSAIAVLSGATMNVSSGAQLTAGSALSLLDSGTFNYFNSTLSLSSLSGASTGILNLHGTALTIASTTYAGIIGGTGGSVTFTGSGNFAGTINDGTSSPISVIVNNSGGTLILSGSSTYSGGTYLQAGVLEVGTAASLGTGSIVLQGGLIGASAPDVNLANNVTGGALVVASGTNVLELSGAGSTYTGPVVIQATAGTSLGGTLAIDTAKALGAATSIIVGSGGAFEVNDSTGTAGVGATVQITGGGVYLTNASGYNGSSGALRGGDNTASVWAGNVNVSGPSYIVPGAATSGPASLTITGSIFGGGPVVFTGSPSDTAAGGTIILAPSAGNTNTYTGETQLIGEPNPTGGTTLLQLGANNALSQSTGLNIVSGSAAQNVNFDLAGYNQSIAYLSGNAQTGYAIVNSGTRQSILTINSGSNSITTASGTAIQGNIAVVKAGVGSQALSGSSTYSGGTTISGGTLTVTAASALGSGVVTLHGGTLALASGVGGSGAAVPIVNGLSSTTFTTNGSNSISGSSLILTDPGTGGENTSVFTNTPISFGNGFVASYQYTVTSRYAYSGSEHYAADGMSFVLQNVGVNAMGAGGGQLGWGGIGSPSAGLLTNIYTYESSPGNAFATNGAATTGYMYTSTDPDLSDLEGDSSPLTFNVTLAYNASAQVITQVMSSTSGTYTNNFSTGNLTSLLGGSTAYIGFTGSDGYDFAGQSISNFTYSVFASGPTSIANSVVAAPGTSSAIQLSVASGFEAGAIGSLNIASGALVQITASSADGIATHGILTTTGLSISGSANHWTGLLDITNNAVDIQNGNIAMATNQAKQGYANGTWQGSGGITSSTAAADSIHLTAVGVIQNSIDGTTSSTALYGSFSALGLFDGISPSAGDVLVKYTYYGDTDLSGVVDGDDYSRIDNAYENNLTSSAANQLTGWFNGDFNYDGVVDGSDYTLIDNAFNMQGAALTASVATPTAEIAGSAVPEPTTLSLLAIGAVGLLGRRRRTDARPH